MPQTLNTSDRSRVLTQAVAEAARRLALKASDLKEIIGTSQPTVSRLMRGHYALPEPGKTWELGAHLVRLYRSLASMVGGDDALARVWLGSANRDFDNRAPLEIIKRIDGLIHVCEYLDAYRARV
ncbi:MAG: DUF2384 domain-containing protein [Gammaproteobacteria bacterium]|nr:DUF2384 domain-containing protein [Gammaproteobacteria bacterium]